MEYEEIKSQMKALWKATFHDSDEYIDLVFDSYFDPEYVEYFEEGGTIKSAALGIPYKFGNDKYHISGVYLCGLATTPDYRKKGIMGRLIEKAAERMKQKGYAFLFLIPADEGLKRYYMDRQFIPFSYMNQYHYVEGHDFRRDYLSKFTYEEEAVRKEKENSYDSLKTVRIDAEEIKISKELRCEISHNLAEFSSKQHIMGILQSDRQYGIALKENAISGGSVIVCRDRENNIKGVAFADSGEEEIKVRKLFADTHMSGYRTMEGVVKAFPDSPLTLETYLGEWGGMWSGEAHPAQLWQPFYSAENPDSSMAGAVGEMERPYDPSKGAKMYGMARILDISQILKFQASMKRDLKYSILADLGNKGKNTLITIADGTVWLEENDGKEIRNEGVQTIPEIGQLLFRKTGEDDTVAVVLGIPPIYAPIYLMLD